jgi:hypothetical protein
MATLNYRPQMEQLSAEELVAVVDFGAVDGYVPEAVGVANEVLALRQIPDAELESIRSRIKGRRKDVERAAAEPIPFWLKFQFFLLSFGALPSGAVNGILMRGFGVRLAFLPSLVVEGICFVGPFALAVNEGSRKRARHAFLWMLYGFLIWGIVFWLLRIPVLSEPWNQYQRP